jgi:hypothetical protein
MIDRWPNKIRRSREPLHVESMTNPDGPVDRTVDSNVGFTVGGKVELPAWLNGTGIVSLNASKIEGTSSEVVGQSTISIGGQSASDDDVTYNWEIPVTGGFSEGPDLYRLNVTFTVDAPSESGTDIASTLDLGIFEVE